MQEQFQQVESKSFAKPKVWYDGEWVNFIYPCGKWKFLQFVNSEWHATESGLSSICSSCNGANSFRDDLVLQILSSSNSLETNRKKYYQALSFSRSMIWFFTAFSFWEGELSPFIFQLYMFDPCAVTWKFCYLQIFLKFSKILS